MAQNMNALLQALQDPQQKDMLATKAAAGGPPPDLNMANVPAVPGVPQQMPQPNPQFQSGLAGIGSGAPTGDLEENKSKWLQFMDALADPNGPAMPLLAMGAKLLQPRFSGTTQAGRIGEGLMDFAGTMAQQRSAAKQAGLKEREVSAQEKLAEAEVAKSGAQTQQIERETESADVMDDLAKARAELARAQAGAQNAGDAKTVIFDTTAKALFNSYPDKYKTLDEAKVALRTFEITKGNTNEAKAITQLMENLPFMPEDRVQPTLDLIRETLAGTDEPPEGASNQRYQEQVERVRQEVPVDSITDEQWLSFETTNKEARKLAEDAYGKDVVAQKIREAKQARGMR